MGHYRVTVDTGGTFSDFVYVNESTKEISIAKIPSTPDDPSRAIREGVQLLIDQGISPEEITYFCHGTTVGTNALLEEKGVRTALLVTAGFKGIYEVQEQSRPHGSVIFDILYDRPQRLVPSSLTGEVSERVDAQGHVIQQLDEQRLQETLKQLAIHDVESIAVCLLFSFLHPAHEKRVRDIIEQELPGVNVSLSSEIMPQIREYYRLSTTVINAYLQPILAKYIANLDQRLNELGISTLQKYIMQSNGGMSTFEATSRQAVATVLSGPAGGITAAANAALMTGFQNLITFDMGGTSCDVALIKDGEPSISNRSKIDGRDIALPMIDINTVSAGGGTIAQIDRFGALAVGPHSAGAVPGPACYGRGGTLPTITDCNLALGYLGEDNFLGGGMKLDKAASVAAIESVAKPLGMDVYTLAEGIIRIINVKMQEAVKAISTMRGHDLQEFMLLGFGGAGPLHAGAIAEELGMAGVIIPYYPGVYSAMGLVMSDVKHDSVRSRLTKINSISEHEVNDFFEDMLKSAKQQLSNEGFEDKDIIIEKSLDMRYAGQGYEITIPIPDGNLGDGDLRTLRSQFDEYHRKMFGHTAPQKPVEIVSYRLRGVGKVTPIEQPKFKPLGLPLQDAIHEYREMIFDGKPQKCPVYQRDRLDVGASFTGPAVIDQLDCTTVLFPGQTAKVDEYKNLIIKRKEG